MTGNSLGTPCIESEPPTYSPTNAPTPIPMPTSYRYYDFIALSALYHTNMDTSASYLNRWMTGQPCNSSQGLSWDGIFCSSGVVTALNLAPVASFNGTLPTEFGLLSGLTSLTSFRSKDFFGTLPTEVGLLTNLNEKFDFSANTFSGRLPSEIGQMTKLESEFNVACNEFSGDLPTQIGQLQELIFDLKLNNNEFAYEIPTVGNQIYMNASGVSFTIMCFDYVR